MRKRKSSDEFSDVNRELQRVINSGKVRIGSREVLKSLRGDEDQAKAVIHASNCPEWIKDEFNKIAKGENNNIIFYEYPASSLELGLACRKTHPIASLCIIDTGGSEILRLLSYNVQSKEKITKNVGGD